MFKISEPAVIALVCYDAPLEEVDKFVAEHRAYIADEKTFEVQP